MARSHRTAGRPADQPPPPGSRPRYQVLVYELIGDERCCIMDLTGVSFIGAVGNPAGPFDVTDCQIGRAGPPRMLNDLALTIADVLADGGNPSPTGCVRR
jgi:hypothetical protein